MHSSASLLEKALLWIASKMLEIETIISSKNLSSNKLKKNNFCHFFNHTLIL